MGVFQSAYSIGMFAGPPISTQLAELYGISYMSAVTATAILVVGIILSLFYNNKLNKTNQENPISKISNKNQ